MAEQSWLIEQSGFDPRTFKALEGLFTLGGAGLHVRGSLEQPVPGEPQDAVYDRRAANVTSERFRERVTKLGTYVPGVYAAHPTLNMQLVNLPSPIGLEVRCGGASLEPGGAGIVGDARVLDMRRALLTRRVRWRVGDGADGPVELTLVFERFVSRVRNGLLAQRLRIESDREAGVRVSGTIDARVTTNGFDHFREIAWEDGPGGGLGLRLTLDSGETVRYVSALRGAGAASNEVDGRRGAAVIEARVGPGRGLTVEKLTGVVAGDGAAVDVASIPGWEELLAEHEAAWAEAWASCDVEIDGDGDAQRAVRAGLFHLLRSHPCTDRAAIDAKGYAGEAYWGRFFWDTEIYLLPFFLHTQPERARELVMFRVRTLEGARENARSRGQAGARYAWESDCRGIECCPNWPYADHEIHVSADVVFGLEHYARGTGDDTFLEGPARETIEAVGEFWLDRLDHRAGDDRPHLLGVMGPDEYTPISSNNAFTNRMAARALERAASCGGPRAGAMREAARALPVPRDGDLILQCEEWRLLGEPEFDRLWKDRARTFASQVPQEKLYRSRCLKQADVLMLMALFPHEFTDDEVRAAWAEYVPYTTHDSSLSAGAHALVALRLGLDDEAWRFWRMGSGIDLDAEHGGAAEGVHIASAGSAWQMVVHGFGGVRTAMETDVLTLRPRLPGAWESVRFPLAWRGSRVRVTAERGLVRVEHSGGPGLEVEVGGERRSLAPGASEEWRP